MRQIESWGSQGFPHAEGLDDKGKPFQDLLHWDEDTLSVGNPMPQLIGRIFNPETGQFEDFNSNSIDATSPLIIGTPNKFGEDSPDCRNQAIQFEALYKELKASGIFVAQVTTQPEKEILKFIETQGVTHPIIVVKPEMAQQIGATIRTGVGRGGQILASPDFWEPNKERTARTLFVAGPASQDSGERRIIMRQRFGDQEAPLRFALAAMKAQQLLPRRR